MLEQKVSLASNGVVKVPGYEQLLRFGYTKNRGVYRLAVTASGEWDGLTIRAFWHTPGGQDPPSSLVADGYVDVPASVTAQPGNGCITFEGSDGAKTVTSADLRYRVSANSGTEDGTMPEPGTPAWQQLVKVVHTNATAAEQARKDAETAADRAESAQQSTESAKTDALTAIGISMQDALDVVQEAQSGAVEAVSAAKTTAVNAVDDKEKEALANISTGIDPTLSVSGKAADAAKVGETVNAEAERAKGVESQIKEDIVNLLKGRVFAGTVSTASKIPSWNVPVYYYAFKEGTYNNFGGLKLYTTANYIYNTVKNGVTTGWKTYEFPFLLTWNLTNKGVLVADIDTVPQAIHIKSRQWYIATNPGTYSNFIGFDGAPITLEVGKIGVLRANGDGYTGKTWWDKTEINLNIKDYVSQSVISSGWVYSGHIDTTGKPRNETGLAQLFIADENGTYNNFDLYDGSGKVEVDNETGALSVIRTITMDKKPIGFASDTIPIVSTKYVRIDSERSKTWSETGNDLCTIIGPRNNTTGVGNKHVILGCENLLYATTANSDIAIGYHSQFRQRTGDRNVSVGNESQDNLSFGSYNTSIGTSSLRAQRVPKYDDVTSDGETLNYNVAIGGMCMYYTYGDNNTAIGYEALRGSTYGSTGNRNVAIGAYAGKYNSDESDHLFVDDRDRGNRENEINKGLIYGAFGDKITDQFIKVNGMFSCNGATPVPPVTANDDAKDLATAIALLNQIKRVLIECGIMKQ